MDSLIPLSKISGLTQGMFVGYVSDNFDQQSWISAFDEGVIGGLDKSFFI